MKTEEIQNLFTKFECIVCDFQGVECWSARELQKLLGYAKWQTFSVSIEKAKVACKQAGQDVGHHFTGASKMVELGSGSVREIDDYLLTRYACYLIAQNGDSRKPEIAFAQNYFAIQTRRAELVEKRILESERVQARNELAQTEKILSGVLYEHGVDSKGFAVIRSKGDKALFHLDTALLKRKYGAPENRAVADFLPTVSITAKKLAAEMTSVNVQSKDLYGQQPIENEHVENNKAVREMLVSRGIVPEQLPPAEDIKKVEKRLKKDDKAALATDN